MGQNRKRNGIIDRNEFRGDRDKSLEEWNSKENNIENPVGGYGKGDNRECAEGNR